MYQVIRSQGLSWILSREAVPAGIALVLAEVFYKFHSFTLEVLAFAATWYAASWLWHLAFGVLPGVLNPREAVPGAALRDIAPRDGGGGLKV